MEHRQTINDDPSGRERRYGLPGHGQARVSIWSVKRSVIDDPMMMRSCLIEVAINRSIVA